MPVPNDVAARVEAEFPSGEVRARIEQLMEASESPRIQRCIVFASKGNGARFESLCRLAKLDWRDVIMTAEYDRNETRLYDFNKPFEQARLLTDH